MNQTPQQTNTKSEQKPQAPFEGFMEFIRQQGVIGLAVGLVLGTQIKVVVDTFIASFLNPILGIILPGSGDLSQKIFVLDVFDKRAEFAWGQFVYVLISFVAVAVIIYYIIKALRLDKLAKR
jgi:large conductance mechanosensitive channel